MAAPDGVSPGPKTQESREEVKQSLRRVLENGHGRAAALSDVLKVSKYSHQTVNERLKELREDDNSGVCHGEIGGTTVYWLEEESKVTALNSALSPVFRWLSTTLRGGGKA